MRIRVMLVAVVLTTTVFTACGDDDVVADAPTTTVAAPSTTMAPAPIIVKDFSFSGLTAKAGTRVLVQNEGPMTHTFTAESNAFDTGPINAGSNAQFTVPSAPGTYKVKCTIHPTQMTGDLKVT